MATRQKEYNHTEIIKYQTNHQAHKCQLCIQPRILKVDASYELKQTLSSLLILIFGDRKQIINSKLQQSVQAVYITMQNSQNFKLQQSTMRKQTLKTDFRQQNIPKNPGNDQQISKIENMYIFKAMCFLAAIWCLIIAVLTIRSIQNRNNKQQEGPIFYALSPISSDNNGLKEGISTEEMQKQFSRLNVQSFNLQRNKTDFSRSFNISISGNIQTPSKKGFKFQNFGISQDVQVGSDFDYLRIKDRINFTELEASLLNSISYELFEFKKDLSLQKTPYNPPHQAIPFQEKIPKLTLAQNLVANPKDKKLLISQFNYYNNKYWIEKNTNQIPICIVAVGYEIFSKNRYKPFFESMESQSYTNFHIVYIDDNSPDQSAYRIFDYLNKTNSRLTNRIKIVHNLQRLGTLANLFFWTKKYCGEDQIVAVIDPYDSLIGNQGLNVLNSVYRNPNRFFTYTRYIEYKDNQLYEGEASLSFAGVTELYRVNVGPLFISHLTTWRKKLLNSVPIEHLIEFYYDESKKVAYPHFYEYSTDKFLIYSLVELAGTDRLYHLAEYLYFHDATAKVNQVSCYKTLQRYNELKSKLKVPLLRLEKLGQLPVFTKQVRIPLNLLKILGEQYTKYKNCLANQKLTAI